MFETLGFENVTAVESSFFFGLLMGAVFGILAQLSRFCLRRAVAGPALQRQPALAVWLMALAIALLGTQLAVHKGIIDFSEHRFYSTDIPVLAIVLGGALFGIGMVLTRGCVSRMTVLIGSGNLRALSVLLVFAVVWMYSDMSSAG